MELSLTHSPLLLGLCNSIPYFLGVTIGAPWMNIGSLSPMQYTQKCQEHSHAVGRAHVLAGRALGEERSAGHMDKLAEPANPAAMSLWGCWVLHRAGFIIRRSPPDTSGHIKTFQRNLAW